MPPWQSVVLHKMAVSSQRNTFPIALGVRIAGVDDATYSQTGEAYSTVALPATDMHTSRTLQEEGGQGGIAAFLPASPPSCTDII